MKDLPKLSPIRKQKKHERKSKRFSPIKNEVAPIFFEKHIKERRGKVSPHSWKMYGFTRQVFEMRVKVKSSRCS